MFQEHVSRVIKSPLNFLCLPEIAEPLKWHRRGIAEPLKWHRRGSEILTKRTGSRNNNLFFFSKNAATGCPQDHPFVDSTRVVAS